MSVCLKCGANIKTTYKFCMSCGYAVHQSVQQTTSNNAASNNTTPTKTVCIGCGSTIKVTDKFCMRCGCPTQLQTQQKTINRNQKISYTPPDWNRDGYINELNRIYSHFYLVQPTYDDYDDKMRISAEKTAEYYSLNDLDDLYNKLLFFSSATGIILIILGFWFWDKTEPLLNQAVWFIAGSIIGSIGVFLEVIKLLFRRKIRKEIKECNTIRASLAAELTKHYANFGYCIVGPEYTNPRILSKIIMNLRCEKVHSFDEAIKKLYHDVHKTEYQAKKMIIKETKNNDSYGEKTAAAFIPAYFFMQENK